MSTRLYDDRPALALRCDAGADHGLGHLSRCLAIADAARQAGAGTFLYMAAPDDLCKRAGAHGHAVIGAETPARGSGDAASFAQFVTTLFGDRPVAVLLDGKYVDAAYVEAYRAARPADRLAALDDEGLRDLPVDLLINPHPFAGPDAYAARAGRRLLLGPTYNTIRAGYFAAAATADRRGVLITMGGEDPGNHSAWLLATLADLLADHPVEVVQGPAHPDPAALRAAITDHAPHATLTVAPADLESPMRRARIALSAGGTTCYELMAAGIATAVVAVEPHQRVLIEALRQRGTIIDLGGATLDRNATRTQVRNLLSDSALSAGLIAAGRSLFPRPGAPEIARMLLHGEP